jgi:hypothetical protein
MIQKKSPGSIEPGDGTPSVKKWNKRPKKNRSMNFTKSKLKSKYRMRTGREVEIESVNVVQVEVQLSLKSKLTAITLIQFAVLKTRE